MKDYRLRHDNIHLYSNYSSRIPRSISNYFGQLSRKPPIPRARAHTRSKEAVTRRNRRRHKNSTKLQQQFFICRTIESPWTLQNVKISLRVNLIHYTKLPPVQGHLKEIQFNNYPDLQVAAATFSDDLFSTAYFPEERQSSPLPHSPDCP